MKARLLAKLPDPEDARAIKLGGIEHNSAFRAAARRTLFPTSDVDIGRGAATCFGSGCCQAEIGKKFLNGAIRSMRSSGTFPRQTLTLTSTAVLLASDAKVSWCRDYPIGRPEPRGRKGPLYDRVF